MQLGLGPFTDLTLLEFNDRQNGLDELAGVAKEEHEVFLDVDGLPDVVNWVDRGAVRPPGDQGVMCASCWAFAAVSAIESVHQISTGYLLDLSEQELVDCDRGCHGCKGVPSALFTASGFWPCVS